MPEVPTIKVTCVTPKQATAHTTILGVTTVDGARSAPSSKVRGDDKAEYLDWYLGQDAVQLGFGHVVDTPGKSSLLVLVGLGDPATLTATKLSTAMSRGLSHARRLGAHDVATTLVADSGLDAATATDAVVQGAILGNLRFDQWRSKPTGKDAKKDQPRIDSLQVVHDKPASIRTAAKRAVILADAVNDARLLANTPANIATPKWMATQARARGKKHGFSVSVKGRAALRKEGFNALCGVAQGSDNEEQLIVMEHRPDGWDAKKGKTLALVGKGVTFDSGGISIKPGNGMWDMKYDKCGACNVIALMGTLKALGVKHRVIGITPCVENMPGGHAQRPGDIITAKDGTTIEILNTDAEGRLILADAIAHARTFKPDWIIEQSTLTGACEFAVGKTFVAAMSKDDAFVDSIVDAAGRAGDKAWKLPQGDEFDDGNKGTYADLQNISLKVKAGTSIGGAFVGHFAKDTKFCHLDIASKAWVDQLDYFGKGPTGAGLRIVVQRILDEA